MAPSRLRYESDSRSSSSGSGDDRHRTKSSPRVSSKEESSRSRIHRTTDHNSHNKKKNYSGDDDDDVRRSNADNRHHRHRHHGPHGPHDNEADEEIDRRRRLPEDNDKEVRRSRNDDRHGRRRHDSEDDDDEVDRRRRRPDEKNDRTDNRDQQRQQPERARRNDKDRERSRKDNDVDVDDDGDREVGELGEREREEVDDRLKKREREGDLNERRRQRDGRYSERRNYSDDEYEKKKKKKDSRDRRSDRDREGRWHRDANDSDSDSPINHRRKEKSRDDREVEKKRDKDVKEDPISKEEESAVVQQMPDANVIRTGGIYIPPHRMAQMMREVQNKSSEQYQRLSWDALRKSINGLVNKVNATNIKNIIPELFAENLIRGRGLFCRSCMKSQMASPGFTDVFAALVAVVNTKFPELGQLLLKRIVLQLQRAYKRNDKPQLLAATKFIAHLVNQQVAHEIIALELLTLLLEKPTDDSVEVAVGFVKECGAVLQDISPQGLHGIFERFRGILHEGEIDKRVQFLIEGLFAIRKAKFQGFPAIRPELDLVEQEDQLTYEVSLEDEIDPETNLDVFRANPQFLEDEKAYEDLKRSILGDESSDDEEGSDAGSDDEDEEESEDEEENMEIKDETETNLVNLRRTIYLTIMSSVDFEEAGHKLLKIKLEPGQEMELCIMMLECCSQERTYLRYYGLLGQRFCMINKVYQENFEKCFVQQYSMIHRLETNKLRNVAKFFAHLLGTSALPWHVLSYIRLTEEDTTSSSRIFIKILFQELSEHLGIRLLNEHLNDPTMQDSFDSIFPKDNPKNTRFSINFFTSIGLGGITESLREYLKNMPRLIMQQQQPVPESDDESGSSPSSSGSSSSGSDSSSESESDSSDGSERSEKRNKRRRN